MFSKGTTSFTRELPECGLSAKDGRYQSESLSISTLDKDEEKAFRDKDSVAQNGPNGRLDLLGRPIAGAKYRPHSERYRKLQLACYNFLERPHAFLPHLYHVSICILVIVSLILTALTTVQTETKNYWEILHTPVFVVEFILVIVFLVEYCLRLWSAGCRSTYVGIKGRLKFAKKTYAILDVVVIISSICALAVLLATSKVATTPVSLIRFLPLLRVLRFDRQGGTWKLLASVIYIHRQELVTTLYLGFISLIFASFVLYLVEKDENAKFDSWPNSFWWGIVTLTTIGYGDKTPITWYGRLCAALFAVFGISFFALPAGILGSGFALKVTQQQRQKHFHRRRRPAAILLQSHWRMYCADINSKSVATWLPHIYYHRQGASDKIVSSSVVDSSSSNTAKKGPRKLSAVWKNRNEGKTSRSQSVDVIRGSRSDSSPLVDSGGSATQRGSISSTLDTGFFVPGENMQCTLVYTKKPLNTSRMFASDEANISVSEDGERPTIMLTQAQKHAIRLIRLLKLNVAIRKFKEARKPYDVKDVIEQYSTGHVEMLSRMKSLQQRIDKVAGERESSVYDDSSFKSNVSARLMKVEHQVSLLDRKVDVILNLLTQMAGTDPRIYETLPGGSPPPPPPDDGQIGIGLPTLVIGSDKNLDSRIRSDSFPSSHALSDSIPPWNPKHSQSDPVLRYDGMSDLRVQGPRTPSLSSEDSHESKDMDCLNAPGMSTVSPNRILGAHGRQLSDVTEGDESVSSDSKENALDNKFSRESTLDSIEDEKEPSSPSEEVDIPMYDPLLNPYVPDKIATASPQDSIGVWDKKPEVHVSRPRSYKHSSTSSFGTLVGSVENEGNSSVEVFQEPSIDNEDYQPASKTQGLSEVDSESVESDQTVVSTDDAKAKRRALRRCTPIEV